MAQNLSKQHSGSRGVLDSIVKTVLGSVDSDKLSFKEMGGDSLAAIRVSNLLKEKLNIDVPICLLASSYYNLTLC